MIIITDTREQNPYSFSKWDVEVQTGTLSTGDYSLLGYEDVVAIERKGIDDLVSCFMGENRNRFERELARARDYELFVVVVEASLTDIGRGRYKSNMNPHAALQSMTTFFIRYSTPFLCCGSRPGAEYMTYSLLAKYVYELEKQNQLEGAGNE